MQILGHKFKRPARTIEVSFLNDLSNDTFYNMKIEKSGDNIMKL